jgi:hypothetical protein
MLAGATGLFGLSFPAHAMAQTADASKPPELATAMPEVRRAGGGRLKAWGFDIYDANLWVIPGFRADGWAQRPFALELRYLRNFDGEDIAKRSIDEIKRAGPVSDAQAAQWMREMKGAFPNVRKGDRLVGVYEPDVGARFFYNGTPTASIADPQFAQRFFAIWLGAKTSEPEMREALFGK